MKFISFLGAMLMLWVSMTIIGMDIMSFIDLPSMLIVFSGAFFTLVNFKFSEIYNAFKDAIGSKNDGFEKRYRIDKQIIKTMSSYVLFASIIGLIFGLMAILSNLENPSTLGPSIAVSIIVVFYAIFLKLFIFIPLDISLEKKFFNINKG